MASSLLFLIAFCSVSGAGCDLNGYDHTAPTALRGVIQSHLLDMEYASDADDAGDHKKIWNYVWNKNADRGIRVSWPKVGIGTPIWTPLPAGDCAITAEDTAESVRVDSDAPISYGILLDQKRQTSVYLAQNERKLGSTNSAVRTSYTGEDGKPVDVEVAVSTSQTPKGIRFAIERSPGLWIGIANLPDVLSPTQIDVMSTAGENQDALVVNTTYGQFISASDIKELAPLFEEGAAPNEKTDFLFFTGKSTKFGVEVPNNSETERVSTNMVILDARTKRPVFVSRVSLVVPAR